MILRTAFSALLSMQALPAFAWDEAVPFHEHFRETIGHCAELLSSKQNAWASYMSGHGGLEIKPSSEVYKTWLELNYDASSVDGKSAGVYRRTKSETVEITVGSIKRRYESGNMRMFALDNGEILQVFMPSASDGLAFENMPYPACSLSGLGHVSLQLARDAITRAIKTEEMLSHDQPGKMVLQMKDIAGNTYTVRSREALSDDVAVLENTVPVYDIVLTYPIRLKKR